MDPPRQVSRRGPGTGPVFRTFKKSAMHSFSAGNSFSIRTSSVPPGVVLPPRVIAPASLLPRFKCGPPAPSAVVVAATPPAAPITVIVAPVPRVVDPVNKRARMNSDKSNMINARDVTLYSQKIKPLEDFNMDAVLNPRSRGNRGIRTSGIHKVEDAAVIAAANATLLRNASVKDLIERKTDSCKTDRPKRVRRQQGKPRRLSASTEKVKRLVYPRSAYQHHFN